MPPITRNEFDQSWDAGPPKSDIEGWNHARLQDLKNIATSITCSRLHGHDESLKSPEAIAEESVELAAKIIEACEKKRPRF
jgi:hypothetical protein